MSDSQRLNVEYLSDNTQETIDRVVKMREQIVIYINNYEIFKEEYIRKNDNVGNLIEQVNNITLNLLELFDASASLAHVQLSIFYLATHIYLGTLPDYNVECSDITEKILENHPLTQVGDIVND